MSWAPPVIAFAVVGAVFWASCVLPCTISRRRERRRSSPPPRVRRLPPGTITTLRCGCAWHHDGLGQWTPCGEHADPVSRELLEESL